MKIVLIGFMGAGKSSLAGALAQRTGLPLLELDALILEASGRDSIAAIFAKDGEAHFRALETACIEQLADRTDAIISTGGGVVQDPQNIATLKQAGGILVYLHAPFSILAERVAGDTSRPLFTDRSQAEALYTRRLPLYEEAADITLDTQEADPPGLAEILWQTLQDENIQAIRKRDP